MIGTVRVRFGDRIEEMPSVHYARPLWGLGGQVIGELPDARPLLPDGFWLSEHLPDADGVRFTAYRREA